MIYNLEYITHPIEKVNEVVISFLKNSIPKKKYSDTIFPTWFIPVITSSTELKKDFQTAHRELQALSKAEREKIYNDFIGGVDIFSVCSDTSKNIVDTESYSNLHEALNALLKVRFFGSTLKSNKTFITQIKTDLGSHYRAFKAKNNKGRVCPFCGIHEYAIPEGESKDDYDHWLYKAKYPLYAINFANLVPMCGPCNKAGVKGDADVLHDKTSGKRRKSYYPYQEHKDIEVVVEDFCPTYVLTQEQQELYSYGYFKVTAKGVDEELEELQNWKEVFNIESRYSSYLSSYHPGLSQEFFEEYLNQHPEVYFDKGTPLNELQAIVLRFKEQLGNKVRRTGVLIDKAYLDFICQKENAHLLYSFLKINLAVT
jgi:hypothetical protein